MLFRILLILISLFLPSLSATSDQTIATQYLFILFDAGETYALKPVMDELERRHENYFILAMGTARLLMETFPNQNHIVKMKELDDSMSIDKHWERERLIPSHTLYSIINKIHPQIVISGVASMIQGQLLEAFRQQQVKTFAFWDNLSYQGSNPYFTTALKVQELAAYVLLPSEEVANGHPFVSRPSFEKHVVGQPSLEQWDAEVRAMNIENILEKLPFNFKNQSNPTIITYIGSYGEEYQNAFYFFLECLKALHNQYDAFHVLIKLHPKVDGSFEQKALEERLDNQMRRCVSVANSTISTAETVAIAKWIITYNSTVGFQALYCQKPVIFITPSNDDYSNLAIEHQLAQKISSSEKFIHSLLVGNRNELHEGIQKVLGIPSHSVDLILKAVNE